MVTFRRATFVLPNGLKIVRGLVERYWDSFFSLVDEEGLATRLAPVTGLNGSGNEGTLIQPLRKIPVTVAQDDGAYAIYQYDQARALAKLAASFILARSSNLARARNG